MGKFKGIITAIITPFNKYGELYRQGIKNEIKYLHDNGIKNLFINGSYGGFPLMTKSERLQAARDAVIQAKKYKMKSIVQIGDPSTKKAVYLAQHAEGLGVDAISAVVPFYYSTTIYEEKHFLKYFERIINSVSIGVHLYNNPSTTGFNASPAVLKKLMNLGLAGIKDGGSDMGRMLEMLHIIGDKDFDYYPSSTASIITGFLLGAGSCISGVSITVPNLILSIYNDVINGKVDNAIKTWKKVMEVRSALGKRSGRAIGAYDVLKAKGVDAGMCREPWQSLTPKESDELINKLTDLGVL